VAKDKVLAMMENAMRYLEWVNASGYSPRNDGAHAVLLMLDSEADINWGSITARSWKTCPISWKLWIKMRMLC